jgi:hypothetical protein
MSQKMNRNRIREWTLLILLSMLFSCCIGVFAGETDGGDSPQDVFKAAQAAGAKKNFKTLAKLVAPSEQAMLAFGMDMGVGMFVEFYEGEKSEALKKEYQKVQEKYEIKTESEEDGDKLQVTSDTPQEVIDAHIRKRAQKLYGQVDVSAYVPELMAIIVNMPEMAEQSFFPQEELTDLKIEGNKATGMAGEKAVSFIKEGGRWYLIADVMN